MQKSRGSALVVTLSTVILVLAATIAVSGQVTPELPDVAFGLDTSYFSGTMACEAKFLGVEYVDGVEHWKSHDTCTTETTDPRVSGSEEFDIVFYGTGQGEGGPWTADGVITMADGTWRGTGRGMKTYDGASGLGMAGLGFSFGDMTYIGEGAYEGLVMHYYMAGLQGNTAVSGWVTPAE